VIGVGPGAGSPQASKAPARFHLSSLYEILFRPENNTIAPLTNIAPPAAEPTGNPWPGALLKPATNLVEPAPAIPAETKPKIPQPTNTVPMADANFTQTSDRANLDPSRFFIAFPDPDPRRNHYG
jgi:hypothetical protein